MTDNVHNCMYCLEEVYLPEAIYPCNCTYPKHIHCFQKWISTGPNGPRVKCEICKSPYKLLPHQGFRANPTQSNLWCSEDGIIATRYLRLTNFQKSLVVFWSFWVPLLIFFVIVVFTQMNNKGLVVLTFVCLIMFNSLTVVGILVCQELCIRRRVNPVLELSTPSPSPV